MINYIIKLITISLQYVIMPDYNNRNNNVYAENMIKLGIYYE